MLAERSVVWAESGGKIRLCVVLRTFGNFALCIPATGTERSWHQNVRVPRMSRAGRALSLSKLTFFYGSEAYTEDVECLQPAPGRKCVPELFAQLLQLDLPQFLVRKPER